MTSKPLQDNPTQPVVSLRHVSRTYGDGHGTVVALDDVTVDIRRGDFTAIMGPSGSGKSTLMNVAAGLDDATHGEVVLGGAILSQLDDDARTRLRRSQVGFVFQAFNLVPTLSVRENILLPFELAGRRVDGEGQRWIDHLVHTLGLGDRVSHRPGELSGGQQQRVAIARALASRPAVIFADEPTGNLDSRSSREVLTLLRTAAREYGQSIAMVSHDPVAASYADRILVIAEDAWSPTTARSRHSRSPTFSSGSRSVRHDSAQPHPRVPARAGHGGPGRRPLRHVCRDPDHDLDRAHDRELVTGRRGRGIGVPLGRGRGVHPHRLVCRRRRHRQCRRHGRLGAVAAHRVAAAAGLERP